MTHPILITTLLQTGSLYQHGTSICFSSQNWDLGFFSSKWRFWFCHGELVTLSHLSRCFTACDVLAPSLSAIPLNRYLWFHYFFFLLLALTLRTEKILIYLLMEFMRIESQNWGPWFTLAMYMMTSLFQEGYTFCHSSGTPGDTGYELTFRECYFQNNKEPVTSLLGNSGIQLHMPWFLCLRKSQSLKKPPPPGAPGFLMLFQGKSFYISHWQ